MKRLGVWSAILLSLTAQAAPWWSRSSTEARVSRQPAAIAFLTVAPSIAVVEGIGLPGLNLQLAGRPVSAVPLNLTADIGPYFYTGSQVFRVAVPILFGMDYEFLMPGTKLRPFFGVNLGPVVGSRVVFAMLFRPGLNFDIGHGIALNFEPRLGVIAAAFAFVPQFGARFSL